MPNNYILLERIELNASAASITFSNIPQTGYTDLKVVVSARSDRSGARGYIDVYFNGTFTNQTNRRILGDGSSASSSSEANNWSFIVSGASQTANTFNNAEIYIPNYTSSNAKSFSVDGVQEANETAAYASLVAALTTNTAAITSVTLAPHNGDNFVQYSTFSLYGLAAVGTTPTIAPKASGGSIYSDGTYWYHAFRTSGTFTPQVGLTCDALVIAGGGAGSGNRAGGGGAGGQLALTSQSLTTTGYTVTVGAGGAGVAAASTADGTSGGNSQIGSLTAAVGGGFGGNWQNGGTAGGSGGGGAGFNGSASVPGGSGTSGQGNAGGAGFVSSEPSSYAKAGGGGGAGSAGSAASSTVAGAGGAGSNTYSSWLSATSTGVSGYIAGGGGGGADLRTGSNGSAGSGGAGAGGGINNGTTNTGSGGGGGSYSGSAFSGSGSGGSGLVIIRYTIA